MRRGWLLCLGVVLASCSRGKQTQPSSPQRPVSPPLTIQWSAPELIAPLPEVVDRVTRVSAAKAELPQVVWLEWSADPRQVPSSVMWSEREEAGWCKPRALSTQVQENLYPLLIIADATGESVVAWLDKFPQDWMMCRRHQGEWSAPGPLGVRGAAVTGHLLGKPGQFGFFYREFFWTRTFSTLLTGSTRCRLLFRCLEAGQLGPPAIIAQEGYFDATSAVGSTPNGDLVLAFFAKSARSRGGQGPSELYLSAMPAGKDGWAEPILLAAHPDADNPAILGFSVWAMDVWAESASHVSVAYELQHYTTGSITSGRGDSDVYVATWTKGGDATVHMLRGWPVRPQPIVLGIPRLVGLPDGSLILLYAAGSYLQVAHWWNGEVLATSQEQFPGTIRDIDLDAQGRLHVVGTSEEGLWYRRGTPGWIGH